MNRIQIVWIMLLMNFICSASCQAGGPNSFSEIVIDEVEVLLNPFENVPLGALLQFETTVPCQVNITVKGNIPVQNEFPDFTTDHRIPVIGLYADTTNKVLIELKTEESRAFAEEIDIHTEPLPPILPEIEIVKLDKDRMEPGFHLVEMLIANFGKFLYYPVIFDDDGNIRWFMDMSQTGKITYSPLRLRNGNWLFLSFIDIYEMTDLGELVSKEQMWGYAGDHHIMELNNRNLLMGASRKDATILRDGQPIVSRYDYIIEWNRDGYGKAVREWDIGQYLDVDRTVFPPDYSLDFSSDWFHINSFDYDNDDHSMLVSGRNQGVLKIDGSNQLKWILAPHRSWGPAGRNGNGFQTTEYLLTAIDRSGNPLPETVQLGFESTEDFEWPTGQHAVQKLENGNVLLFDNGMMRDFVGKAKYSRAVEYKIDEESMTIQQVWQYGKGWGLDMYSGITSDVDVLPVTGNRLITAGNVRSGSLPPHAKLVEITYPGNEIIFEANIFFKDALGNKEQTWAQFDLVYKGERYPLYRN